MDPLARTRYRPGDPEPDWGNRTTVTYRDERFGTRATYRTTDVHVYSNLRVTVMVTRTSGRPTAHGTVDMLDARVTSNGFTLEDVNAPFAATFQPVMHDPEFVSWHLAHATNRALDGRGFTDIAEVTDPVTRSWLTRLRLAADIFTLADPTTRTAAWNAFDAGYAGTLEELLAAVAAAHDPTPT